MREGDVDILASKARRSELKRTSLHLLKTKFLPCLLKAIVVKHEEAFTSILPSHILGLFPEKEGGCVSLPSQHSLPCLSKDVAGGTWPMSSLHKVSCSYTLRHLLDTLEA